ncbi:MAG: carboxypeptidase-like regulatory domain-containing protein, partial [Chryseolinea sp.]
MKTLLKLSIPKSCPEKWGNFTTTSTGGYCSRCSKNVVDFTKMNNETIVQFFEDHPNQVCGRFNANQLTVYPNIIARLNPGALLLLKVGLLSLLLASISKQASAQEPVRNTTTQTVQSGATIKGTQTQKVLGIVKDENGDAMPGANVYLKSAAIGTPTKADGSFEFPKELAEGDILVFSFIGYESKEFVVPPATASEPLYIRMVLDLGRTLGEVSVEQVYSSKNRH